MEGLSSIRLHQHLLVDDFFQPRSQSLISAGEVTGNMSSDHLLPDAVDASTKNHLPTATGESEMMVDNSKHKSQQS